MVYTLYLINPNLPSLANLSENFSDLQSTAVYAATTQSLSGRGQQVITCNMTIPHHARNVCVKKTQSIYSSIRKDRELFETLIFYKLFLIHLINNYMYQKELNCVSKVSSGMLFVLFNYLSIYSNTRQDT